MGLSSPLIRKLFLPENANVDASPPTLNTLKKLLESTLFAAGLRAREKGKENSKNRKDMMRFHSFC